MHKPWERRKGESSKAYTHFCLYRDMGEERSLRKMSDDARCSSKVAQLKRWSSRWRWVDRAQAYDDELDRELRAKNEKARREMAERHAKVSVVGQNIVIQKMNEWASKIPNMSFDRAIGAFCRLVEIERLARGEPTEIGKTEHSGSVGVQAATAKMTDIERREQMIRYIIELGHSRERAEELALALMGENDDG